MEQNCYSIILDYLRTGPLPCDLNKNQRDSLRRAKRFLVKDALSYYIDTKRMVELQVKKLRRKIHITQRGIMNKTRNLMPISIQVVTETQKMQVLERCQSDKLGGGYFGRDKTLAKIAEHYY